jgi:hypothetical protein
LLEVRGKDMVKENFEPKLGRKENASQEKTRRQKTSQPLSSQI